MTSIVGQTLIGYFFRNAALVEFSVSTESQTNCPAYRASALSVKTNARIERQVCHHGAQVSTNSGRCVALARAIALLQSFSMNGRTSAARNAGATTRRDKSRRVVLRMERDRSKG